MAPTDPLDLDAISTRAEAAHQMVVNLCKPRDAEGSREWVMSIPVRPDHDPDVVISDSLRDVGSLIAEVQKLRAELALSGRPKLDGGAS